MGVGAKIGGHFFRLNDFYVDYENEKFYIISQSGTTTSDFQPFQI